MVLRFIISFLILFTFPLLGRTYKDFPKASAELGKAKIKNLYLAATENDRQLGLMNISELPEADGVLFVFEDEKKRSFWMKNTFVPLSIGFFDSKGCLLEILDMTPVKSVMQRDIPQYQSTKPAKYALEVQQGWFVNKQISLGMGLRLAHLSSVAKGRDLSPLEAPKCPAGEGLKAN